MEKKKNPLVLRRCLSEVKISFRTLSRMLNFGRNGKGWSSTVVSQVANNTALPAGYKSFQRDCIILVSQNTEIQEWLEDKGLQAKDLFSCDYVPKAVVKAINTREIKKLTSRAGIIRPQNKNPEVTEMLTYNAKQVFGIFREPFVNEVGDVKDIFMSKSHAYIKEAMLDAAKFGGFIAVIGSVGSGKSMMRKAVIEELKELGILVIQPKIIDKKRITANHLLEAIIKDLKGEKIPQSQEARARRAYELLHARSKSGFRQVLFAEEMHLYTVGALKALKQLYELELGFKKMLGIAGLGQPELFDTLDEYSRPDLLEVIRRISVVQIEGLSPATKDHPSEVKEYLELKFGRINKNLSDIMTVDAVKAIENRLTDSDGNRSFSTAYPLSVNNLVIRAMNEAAYLGETTVTSDIINEV